MGAAVPPKIYDLLKNAVSNDIDNYSIVAQGLNKKGEGFMSEMYYVSLKDKHGEKALDFAVKQAYVDGAPRTEFPLRSLFLNEIYFYDKVWQSFERFQRKIPPEKRFDKIPRCFATISDDLGEKLLLENLKCQNFSTFDKKRTLDREHVEYMFKQYGKFHGISFAYKELNPEEYSEISKGLMPLWCDLCAVKSFKSLAKDIHELCLQSLHSKSDAEVIEKYKRYVVDGAKIFSDSTIYDGVYSAVLHGDCWSNNMMLKYDESKKLIDIRLLDFQFCNVGTPVCDLSYCLYSGASKEILDDLDYYLKVYHHSLLETVEEFGCNPDNIYPFEELKKDWKQYCKMGFTLGIMVWRAKLTDDDDIKDLTEMKSSEDTGFMDTAYDEETFKKISRDLILHMYKNDFL